jgi:FKBP-type peptidyl-prolyl cis-trans isomerase
VSASEEIGMSNRTARAWRFAARALAAAVALGAAAACTSPTSPTVKASFTTEDLRLGTGGSAAVGQTLMVYYTGWLYDDTKDDKKGAKFDGTTAGQPFVFKLGYGQVIQGWDQGIIGMKVGGLRKLIIPSEMAYGRAGAGTLIPPNATLVFEVELLSVAGG